jgi:hypothetical protein
VNTTLPWNNIITSSTARFSEELKNLENVLFKISNTFDVRGSVHHSTIHTEKANKMQLCIKTYYSTLT